MIKRFYFLSLITLILSIPQALFSDGETSSTQAEERSPLAEIMQLSNKDIFARKLNAQEALKGAAIINEINMLTQEIMHRPNASDYPFKVLQAALQEKFVNFSLLELDIRFSNDDGSPVTTEQYKTTLRRTHNEFNLITQKYEMLSQEREKFMKNQEASDEAIEEQLTKLKIYKDVVEKESAYLSMKLTAQKHYDELIEKLSPNQDLARILKESITKFHLQNAHTMDVFYDMSWINHTINRKGKRLISNQSLSQGEK